jgi:hypothetical protein
MQLVYVSALQCLRNSVHFKGDDDLRAVSLMKLFGPEQNESASTCLRRAPLKSASALNGVALGLHAE